MSSWRTLLPTLFVACVACNAIVGYDQFQKLTGDPDVDAGTDDDDDTHPKGDSGGGSSSGSDTGAQPETGSGGVDSGLPKRCDPSKPFSTPAVVDAFDGTVANLDTVMLTRDELEAFWVIAPTSTLRSASRTTRNEPWGPAGTIVMSPKVDYLHAITKDGLRMFYAADGAGNGTMVASRVSRTGTWSNGNAITEPAKTGDSFEANSEEIIFLDVFTSGSSSGESNLWTTTFKTTNQMDTFLEKLNPLDEVGSNEWGPVVNASLTNLYFMRDTATDSKIMVSHRPAGSGSWPAPVEEPTLRGQNAYVNWVSDDDCVIYLSRQGKIVSATRPL